MTFEVKTLAKGEKITTPGFYDIPIETHHNQPCDGTSVTSSILRVLRPDGGGTPADVWAYHALNKDRFERPETTALRLGKAMAYFIELGEEGLSREVFVLDEEKPNRVADKYIKTNEEFLENRDSLFVYPKGSPRRPTPAQVAKVEAGEGSESATEGYNFWSPVISDGKTAMEEAEYESANRRAAAIAYWEKIDADPRTIVSDDEWKLLKAMGEAIEKDPAALAALSAAPELTMATRDDKTGLWILSRPDQTGFTGMITDYKKMATRGGYFTSGMVDRRIEAMGYDMQMALAHDAFLELTGERPSALGLVCQNDVPPYSVIVRDLDDDQLEMARFLNRVAIDTFAECLASGEWPGPGENVTSFRRSERGTERIMRLMKEYYG